MAGIIINKPLCKGCALCVSACPKNILKISETEMNEKGYFVMEIVEPAKCIGCASCAVTCPDCVIEVER